MWFIFILFFSSGHNGINGYEVGDCGIRYNTFVPSISDGVPSKPNEFPWHVAIYKVVNTSYYKYICGGSIIEPDIVITAAHCVFNETKNDIDYTRMVIVAGKVNASWEATRGPNEQRLEVISKKVPSRYRGSENRYQDDIALLALNDSIRFSSVVMPICVDWTTSFEPLERDDATIVGWGTNENGVLSEDLEIAEMEQRNFVECRDSAGKGYRSFLTSDKFCAIKKTKSQVQKGDSGGGLVFLWNSRYFIKGILSGREAGSHDYVLFTNISNHMPWVTSTKMVIINDANVRKVCGIAHPATVTNYITRHEEYPWVATIYMEKNNKFFGIRCVGTIIHQRAIITNAWCVHDKRPHYKGVTYRILVGKNELNMKEIVETEQRLDKEKELKQQNYLDWNARSENEMVIIIVDKEIEFTESVAPICLDLDKKFPMEDPSKGMIVSWDIDECHCQVTATYKYLNIENCSQAFGDEEEFEAYVTSDKVCGQYRNGTRFMHGSDIGSGYVFHKNGTERYYLQGIVSKGRPSHPDFLTFTNIEQNLRWINDILTTIYNVGSLSVPKYLT